MRLAAIQMNSGTDVARNLDVAGGLIAEAVDDQHAELVVLPENFSYLGARDSDRLRAAEQPGAGIAQEFLQQMAREHDIWIVGGTIPIWEQQEKTRSRSLLVDPSGEFVAQYDKLHLFDVVIPNREDESYYESETTAPGDAPVVAQTPFASIGMTVCYDLRFPALFHRMSVLGMDLLVVPAAFTVPTGSAHWMPLLETRAFESLAFVVACGQWGEHEGGRLTYGHSCILSPWGETLAVKESGVGIVSHDVDFDSLHDLRTKFPVLRHRREF